MQGRATAKLLTKYCNEIMAPQNNLWVARCASRPDFSHPMAIGIDEIAWKKGCDPGEG